VWCTVTRAASSCTAACAINGSRKRCQHDQLQRRAADSAPKPPANAQKLSWKEARELESLEPRIEDAERERERLAALLAEPGLYQDAAAAAQATEDFRAAQESIDALYARWAELETRDAGE
jgi:ABC transport system ATP-binding/permease protein